MSNPSNHPSNSQLQEHLADIKKRGDTPEAIAQLQDLLKEEPKFIPGWMELGRIHRRRGDRQLALSTFTEALTFAPHHQSLNLELATEQLALNQVDDCQTTIDKILKINPKQEGALLKQGELYRKQQKREEALEVFQKALELKPQSIWNHIRVARELTFLERFDEAKRQLKQALEYAPTHLDVLVKLGELEQKQQQPEQALAYFKQASEHHPNKIQPELKIAEILRKTQQLEEARAHLIQLLEKYPNRFEVLMQLGHLERQRLDREQALKWYSIASEAASNSSQTNNAQLHAIEELRGLGEIDAAVEKITPILQEFPNDPRAKLIYASLFKVKLEFKTAADIYQELIRIDPNKIHPYLELATCLSECGQTQEAIEHLEVIRESNPDDTQILKKLGDLYRKEQDRTQALKSYRQALELDPQNLWANLKVATELRDGGDLEAAQQQIQTTLEYHPNHFHALMQLGQLEQKQQKLETAMERFQAVIEHHPDRIEPRLSQGDILCELGRFDAARNYLKLLQKSYPEEPRVLIKLGQLERKLGSRAKALEWFDLAQEKTSTLTQSLDIQIFAIEELRDLGNFNEAIQKIDRIIEEFPEYRRAQMVKGNILQKQPNLAEAANIYKRILSTEPKNLNARIELARVYSQSGQVESAIALLEKTDRLLGSNSLVFMQLGALNQALEEWEAARQWYEKATQEYPYHPGGYCALANVMSLEGESEAAMELLQEAQVKIPNSIPVLIKLIDLQIRASNLDLARKRLLNALKTFPDNVPLRWQLSRVEMGDGDYPAAFEVLDSISTDNQDWIRKTEQHRANLYFHQYNYPKAEEHLRKAITLAPTAIGERNRLATLLMLDSRINEARQELKIATEELNLKTPPGKAAVPLKSHPAMLINELQINPPLLKQLIETKEKQGYDRILALGSLLSQEPTYLGSALYLARELREQGIFEELQQELSAEATSFSSIPKRIVQFWDDPTPPKEVQRICQSWIDRNPDYEYTRFSIETAIAFLQEHYDAKALKAFSNCDQPATQADFFRLAYLNKMGGFYADADDVCRQSLDTILEYSPELVVLQEDFSCIGNNFLGCIPGQTIIRIAFHQAVTNLLDYCNESPWFATGPGLMTSAVCSGLVPYLTYDNYQMWPRLLVLSQSQLRKMISQHTPLAYKKTDKSWQNNAYQRRIKVTQIFEELAV